MQNPGKIKDHGRCVELCVSINYTVHHSTVLDSVDSEVKLLGFGSCLNHLLTLKPWVRCSTLCVSVFSSVKRDDNRIYSIG